MLKFLIYSELYGSEAVACLPTSAEYSITAVIDTQDELNVTLDDNSVLYTSVLENSEVDCNIAAVGLTAKLSQVRIGASIDQCP